MKTIPVCLIVASFLAPAVSHAQPADGAQGGPKRMGDAKRGMQRAFLEAWKAADRDGDGAISEEEFGMIQRLRGLPEDKRAGLFQRLDKNGNGVLDRMELERINRRQEGQEGPQPGMPRLWELDSDRSGGVSFEEFSAGKIFSKLPPEKQQAVFRHLDANGDGVISPKDRPEPPMRRDGGQSRPRRLDGAKPEGPRMMEPRMMIRELDADGDGSLSFEEFRKGQAVRHLTEDEQEDRFEALDKNKDLKISAADFPAGPPRGEPIVPKKRVAPAPDGDEGA